MACWATKLGCCGTRPTRETGHVDGAGTGCGTTTGWGGWAASAEMATGTKKQRGRPTWASAQVGRRGENARLPAHVGERKRETGRGPGWASRPSAK